VLNLENKNREDNRMTKIFITGGAGFIGSHLVNRLSTEGHEIIVYDNFSQGEPPSDVSSSNHTRYVQGDIRDYDHLLKEIEGSEIVFHLAGQTSVIEAYTDQDYCLTTNILGTNNTLKASKEAGVGRVVFTSSREVYGEALAIPVIEDAPINYKNLYGATKALGEHLCQVYNDDYHLPVVVQRLTNVYGSGDSSRVIPNFIENAQKGEPLVIYGGDQFIDFVWIELVIEALIRAMTYPVAGIPMNIGSGLGVSILDLAESVIQMCHSSSEVTVHPARNVEVTKFVADVTRMKEQLGLSSEVGLIDGLTQMINDPEYRAYKMKTATTRT
jgi:UDP-glucose 4-epimerase